jgi:uncharacterized protein (DUF924 family)
MNNGQPAWEPVLNYWFGDASDDVVCAEEKSALWWGKAAAIDAEIRQRFESVLQLLVNGGNRYWLQFPESRLAAIIALDQFSRNIYRDTPTAFASDQLALNWCLSGIDAGLDKQLRPIERVFFYLPMEHAENLGMQHRCLWQFQQLIEIVPEAHKETFSGFTDYAKQHADVIERFGRFPHRNPILGRESTPEELEYLAQPGSGF